MSAERLGLALLLLTVWFVTNCVNAKDVQMGEKGRGPFSPYSSV